MTSAVMAAASLAAPEAEFCVITCEHARNIIPAAYRRVFRGCEALLRSHEGYDAGALKIARDLAKAMEAALFAATTSRLLIDLNRSQGHPGLYSRISRALPQDMRRDILENYYLPYRATAQGAMAEAIAAGKRVLHISAHSFTPQLRGRMRVADIGLLYDPERALEAALCQRWQRLLMARGDLIVRRNYPYRGNSDGFTAQLRTCFPEHAYLGVELEINQKHVHPGGRHWSALRQLIIATLRVARRNS